MRDKIYEQLKEAMKARDKPKLEGLRYLWSLIKGLEIDAKKELDDKAVEAVAKSEVKKRKEALELMKKGGADLTEEKAKLAAIEKFLPEEMGEEEVEAVVKEVLTGGEKDFGKVMGMVMSKTKGKADGKLVSELVRRELGG